jgi:hypothetical protein
MSVRQRHRVGSNVTTWLRRQVKARRRKMFRRVLVAFAFATFAIGTTQASAAAFTFQFCPSAECTEDGLTSATLRFDELLATADVNDYQLTATILGGPTGSTLDEILISVSNFREADYTTLTLNGAPN